MPSTSRQVHNDAGPSLTERLARRAVDRTVAGRQAEYEREMSRIVETTFELVRTTGTVDPSMREILAATGLSTQAFYRYFASKDECMLAVLDEGRRRLLATLERRMQRARTAPERISAWIEGVLAQASGPAGARTRPWVANEQRLAERFPDEHDASVAVLVALLVPPVSELGGVDAGEARLAASFVYRVTFASLQAALARGSGVSSTEASALVEFCLTGVRR